MCYSDLQHPFVSLLLPRPPRPRPSERTEQATAITDPSSRPPTSTTTAARGSGIGDLSPGSLAATAGWGGRGHGGLPGGAADAAGVAGVHRGVPGDARHDLGGAQLPAAAHEHAGPPGLRQGQHPLPHRQEPRPARAAAGRHGDPQEGLAPQAPDAGARRRRRHVPGRSGHRRPRPVAPGLLRSREPQVYNPGKT